MIFTDNEMCTILLSTYVGIHDDAKYKPLSPGEWNKFVDVLIANKQEPSIVYSDHISLLKEFGYDDLFVERLKTLAGRGAGVAFELSEYEKRGIGVVTFINKNYPIRIRKQLKNKKPPVLFYAGDISLANKVGIGVVGSRNVSKKGIGFTQRLVEKAVDERLVVYSGGAKGVDMTSQNAALGNGGAAVAFLADSLTARIKKKDIISHIADGKLLLFSDLRPDAGFSAGRAMNRNKFIYASAMGTFVVESDYNQGGTWTGAVEAMKNEWGKVLVWDNGAEGNAKLIEKGGQPFDLSDRSLMDVISEPRKEVKTAEYRQMTLMDFGSIKPAE